MRPPEPQYASQYAPQYASRLGRPLFVAVGLGFATALLLAAAGRLAAGWPVALGGLLFALVLIGNFYAPAGIFGRPLVRGGRLPRVALTFDDGPDPESTPQVLDALRRHGARATFFVIGERARRHPELVARLHAEGHQVENHSLRHAWSTPFLPRRRLLAELLETQVIVEGACGRAPRWFRPPIGILSPPVAGAARQAGLRLCHWSCKSRDGLGSTDAAVALRRLAAGATPGAILLLHDAAEGGGRLPVAPVVLERLLPLLAERGLRAVSLDELVGEASPSGPQ